MFKSAKIKPWIRVSFVLKTILKNVDKLVDNPPELCGQLR
jgi:hypothetical protein